MSQGCVLVDVVGTSLTNQDRELLAHPAVSGVVIFRRNYVNKQQLKALTADIKSICGDCIISIDQEGGRVQRLREGFTMLPAMRHWGEVYQDDPELAARELQKITQTMIAELREVGVNLTLVPVLDIDRGISRVIGGRSFYFEADTVTALARTMMNTMKSLGMPTTAKHFPGHGGIATDSHLEAPVDQRLKKVIYDQDMRPFVTLIDDIDAIMPAHVIYSEFDKHPAGFSSFWLQKMLRQELHFKGLIMSDDLTMAAAAAYGDYSERAKAALEAGCDMLVVCNNSEGALQVLDTALNFPDNDRYDRVSKFTHSIKQC